MGDHFAGHVAPQIADQIEMLLLPFRRVAEGFLQFILDVLDRLVEAWLFLFGQVFERLGSKTSP